MPERTYIAIDLKSFYASVECVERGLDPLTTNLVVADISRTEKTICLAVSPALKAHGIGGRARLFEVIEKVGEVNAKRRMGASGRALTGASCDSRELKAHPDWAVDYVVATPRMAFYIEYSTRVYSVYLKYVAPEDIHVYSIDEVFIDATGYLRTYRLTARELAMRMIDDVLRTTGITATAGIGTNLYLSKVAMDIMAKHSPADAHGVRIAELDETAYRQRLWAHRPLTDFWRVGHGIASKLEANGLFTMGDVARCSLGKPDDFHNEELLYRLFGVNAELLIDHAWGWEPCTIADIRAYKPESSSAGVGQVLRCPYPFEKAKVIVREMAEGLALDLLDRGLVTGQIVLTVGYDAERAKDAAFRGETERDRYGRAVPKSAHGSENMERWTSSAKRIVRASLELFGRIADPSLSVRRLYLTANCVVPEAEARRAGECEQLDLFTDYEAEDARREREAAELAREKRVQTAVLSIKRKFGKNAIVKGTSLEEGATGMERNRQIGGHKA